LELETTNRVYIYIRRVWIPDDGFAPASTQVETNLNYATDHASCVLLRTLYAITVLY
jgi:hypothetical protein